jgi:hypothetical protein
VIQASINLPCKSVQDLKAEKINQLWPKVLKVTGQRSGSKKERFYYLASYDHAGTNAPSGDYEMLLRILQSRQREPDNSTSGSAGEASGVGVPAQAAEPASDHSDEELEPASAEEPENENSGRASTQM